MTWVLLCLHFRTILCFTLDAMYGFTLSHALCPRTFRSLRGFLPSCNSPHTVVPMLTVLWRWIRLEENECHRLFENGYFWNAPNASEIVSKHTALTGRLTGSFILFQIFEFISGKMFEMLVFCVWSTARTIKRCTEV